MHITSGITIFLGEMAFTRTPDHTIYPATQPDHTTALETLYVGLKTTDSIGADELRVIERGIRGD
jgi:hypothetical protein